jgi:glycosyltransferase involved in cell wall biosynthesis
LRALLDADVPARLYEGRRAVLMSHRPGGRWMALTWKTHALVSARHPATAPQGLLWLHGAELTRDRSTATGRLRWRTLQRAARLLAVSPLAVSLLPPQLKPKVELIGPPVTAAAPVVEASRPPGGSTAVPLRLLSVGRAVPRKGHDTAIAVARHLARTVRVRLDVVGPGPDLGRLVQLAAQPPAGLRINIHGRVTEATKQRLYAGADALLFLSRTERTEYEGLGLVVLEAAAHGCPSVVVDSGGARFTVAEGQSGVVVPEGAPVPTIARATELITSDRSSRDAAVRFASQFRIGEWHQRVVAAVDGRKVTWSWPTL